jgi:hypothetical protein
VVIVVENGRVSQMGTHEQLMAEEGHYRDIAEVQLSDEDGVGGPMEDLPSHMDRQRDTNAVSSSSR